jgi:hypothetical protein
VAALSEAIARKHEQSAGRTRWLHSEIIHDAGPDARFEVTGQRQAAIAAEE